jgi:hypothetical protein
MKKAQTSKQNRLSRQDLRSSSRRTANASFKEKKKQLESIASQVRQEQDLRADADKELGRGLREQIQGLEKHLGKVADQVASLARDFTDDYLTGTGSFFLPAL